MLGYLFPPLSGLSPFLIYCSIGGLLMVAFGYIYMRLTRHDEIALIIKGNKAAAVVFGANMIGFAVPVNKSIAQASSIIDLLIWALIAAIIQAVVYVLAGKLIPNATEEIEKDNLAVGLFLGTISLVAGLLNAASMTI
jgi:putative membrane protein